MIFEHYEDRTIRLLRAIPKYNLYHVDSEKIPAFLRVDYDVKCQRSILAELHDRYMGLDFTKIQHWIVSELHEELQDSSLELLQKHQTVMDILTAEEQTLQSCIEVNNKNQYLSTENTKLVSDMILENIEFIEDDKMNDHREKKRMDLLELKAQMRDAELEAEGEIIANLNLKKILEIE